MNVCKFCQEKKDCKIQSPFTTWCRRFCPILETPMTSPSLETKIIKLKESLKWALTYVKEWCGRDCQLQHTECHCPCDERKKIEEAEEMLK